jgi:hypothetical protein
VYAVSSNFLAAIRGSHVRSITADIYFNRTYQTTVPVVDGSINVDRNQVCRRSGMLTLGNPLVFPTYVTSPLAPYGAELHVNYNLTYPTGIVEVCPLGVLRVKDVYEEQSTGGMPVVDFQDRSAAVAAYPFVTPYDATGIQLFAVVNLFIAQAVPWASVNWSAGALAAGAATTFIPGGMAFSADRWSAVLSCLALIGCEAYFDVLGVCQVVVTPSLTQAGLSGYSPVWNFNTGAGGVLITAKRTVSRAGVYNAVFVTGGASGSAGAAPTAFASDNDTRSPTYYGPLNQLAPDPASNFGPQVYQYSNTLLTTAAQCQVAANTQLANYLGLARTLNFTSVPNPALEAGDIVQATYSSTSYEMHVIDSFVVPLGPSYQATGTTRTLSYQLTGGT